MILLACSTLSVEGLLDRRDLRAFRAERRAPGPCLPTWMRLVTECEGRAYPSASWSPSNASTDSTDPICWMIASTRSSSRRACLERRRRGISSSQTGHFRVSARFAAGSSDRLWEENGRTYASCSLEETPDYQLRCPRWWANARRRIVCLDRG